MSSDNKSMPTETKNTTTTGGVFTYNRFMLKAKYSLYSALVFFIFANPETSLILQRFFGRFIEIITPRGAPTMSGIFFSTILFFLSMLGLMLLPSE